MSGGHRCEAFGGDAVAAMRVLARCVPPWAIVHTVTLGPVVKVQMMDVGGSGVRKCVRGVFALPFDARRFGDLMTSMHGRLAEEVAAAEPTPSPPLLDSERPAKVPQNDV